MNIIALNVKKGLTRQRPRVLKGGKGKASFKPDVAAGASGTCLNAPEQYQAALELTAYLLEQELQRQLEVAQDCDGNVVF